jgi:uroporphyrinogen III methyltransferase/synthase
MSGERAPGAARSGVVYLVGAGPGDPGLMTARALELVASADVIVHDRLIPAEALADARRDAEVLYVGKEPGDASVPQDRIEEMLATCAKKGKSVVRLKGGDPFVFGRGGEEAEALADAGVPFEVVPGVTAGVAAPAYAGVPVTHREDASAVAFVTGHEDPAKGGSDDDDGSAEGLDYSALAAFPGTLVFYMGVKELPAITGRLIAAGRNASEPAAVVERGTLPDQRTVTATLGEVAEAASEAEVRPPAVTVIGPAAARRERIAWLEHRPLHGKRVVVTRARAQASELARRLASLGAEPVELPAIRIEPRIDSKEVRQAIESLHSYALVCLTSPNGVRLLFEAMAEQGRDARALANATVAAIGPGTAAALAERGVIPDVVPERFVAEALVEALAKLDLNGKPALLARAAEARDVLPDALRDRGAEVDVVTLYETTAEKPEPEALERVAEADYVTFTSSSTVRNFVQAVGDGIPRDARVVTIGPVTSDAAREAGLSINVEAERHDIDGLVEALVADASTS